MRLRRDNSVNFSGASPGPQDMELVIMLTKDTQTDWDWAEFQKKLSGEM